MFNRISYGIISHLSKYQKKRNRRHKDNGVLEQYLPVTEVASVPSEHAKIWTFRIIMLLLVIVLFTRLVELQIVKHSLYEKNAIKNRTTINLEVAPRGVIKDYSGKFIAFNQAFINIDGKEQQLTNQNAASLNPKDITARRSYPCQDACAHLIGYTSLIREEEIAQARSDNLPIINNKQERGRTGLEQSYQNILQGQDGYTAVEVNAEGQKIREIGTEPIVPGKTLRTSINLDLQKYIYEVLMQEIKAQDAKGASAIVMDPRTGTIQAIVSAPSYNNNAFTLYKEQSEQLQGILSDQRLPLLNRAIAGVYPPGSTYKIISSLALLAENIVKKETQITDTGKIELSGLIFNNWYYTSYGKTDGEVNVVKALQRSNDTYYYKASLDLGVDKLETWSRNLGLGAVTGIDLPGEAKGLVPNPNWKLQTVREQWYPGNTVNMSIGQGDLLSTPLQVAIYTAAVANRGTLVVPSIVQAIDDADNQNLCVRDSEQNIWIGKDQACLNLNQKVQKPRQISVNQKYWEYIEEGMLAANSRGGTATPFFDYPIITAGKTGTSESLPGQKPHAWFTVYAPVPNPRVVVTVLVENGGEGSSVGAPVAKKILDYLFL